MAMKLIFAFVFLVWQFGLSFQAQNPYKQVCPTFANRKTGCLPTTCGHFAIVGKFRFHHTEAFRFPNAGVWLGGDSGVPPTVAYCCQQCRKNPNCVFYNYFTRSRRCYMYSEGICTDPRNKYKAYYPRELSSFVGGRCNTEATNDPHLIGARGTPFDFNGVPEKSFCLLTDKDLHVNMELSGYYDNRTEGATAFTPDGRAIRSWVKVLGIVWRKDGVQHSLKFSSRKGASQERGNGFLESIEVDGTVVPRLELGDELNLFDGQAVVTMEAYEKVGPYDVDVYKVVIENLFAAELRLRVAHPLLQLPDDSQVHISLDILDVHYTPVIHGVLGQTYRDDREERALNYTALATLMQAPISADMESGKGFLDGDIGNYISSSVLATDCGFSQYGRTIEVADDALLQEGAALATAATRVTSLPIIREVISHASST